jgi:uncharacterized membrane protein YccC
MLPARGQLDGEKRMHMTWTRTWLTWDGASARRALLLVLGSTLAFAVASLLHLRNPYWAAMPVWVISQPARGILLERSIFRVAGTLVGAALGFALVHAPVPAYVQIVLLALWIALNAGVTHVLRGVHSYAALLAGMTAAIVVIPSLVSPAGAMAIALARVDCTLIGVAVGSLVMALQTPESPLAAFYEDVRAVSSEAVTYAVRVLRSGSKDLIPQERRILDRISQLQQSARLHAAGSVEGYRRLGDVDLLVLGSLSTMAAARAVQDSGVPFDPSLPGCLEAIAGHLRIAWTRPLASVTRHLPVTDDPGLRRLDTGIGEILDADLALAQPGSFRSYHSEARPTEWAPQREWTLAWQEGLLAFITSLAALALAIAVPMPSMGLLAMGVCIFVMVLGSMPLPQLIAPFLVSGVALGVLAGTFYRLVLQPGLGTPALLILSIVPFILAGGFLRTHPRLGPAGVDFCMCFLLASQAGMPASHDVHRILMDSGALLAAAVIMAGLFMLLPHRALRQAADAATQIRRDLQRILSEDVLPGKDLWRARSSRQILRLALHLGRARGLVRRRPQSLLATLNLGHALSDLQEGGMPEAVKVLLAATLRREMTSRAAAQGLVLLADAPGAEGTRRLVRRVAMTLEQVGDL